MITKEEIKQSGATFTPIELAQYLSDKISIYLDEVEVTLLDPACGEGELLLAMANKLEDNKIKTSVKGYDTNTNYLKIANLRLKEAGVEHFTLEQQDFLEAVDFKPSQLLLDFDNGNGRTNNEVNVIIANPPYVRTQVLGGISAQDLAKKFDLKGRVDLYYPFLIGMTSMLKEGGILGVIVSNRFLSTKSGESVRQHLAENYEMLEVIDLGDTKLFNAAVLPAIFIGKKIKNKSNINICSFVKIYEDRQINNEVLINIENIYDILKSEQPGYYKLFDKIYKKTYGTVRVSPTNKGDWELSTNSESLWISKIKENSKGCISDYFKVRVGIKTTADSVFISDNWESLGDDIPEDEVLKKLISQENIERWKTVPGKDLKVLYTHYDLNGRKVIDLLSFPKAANYLNKHKDRLAGRDYVIKAKRKWYEIWVPQNPSLWKFPKLVFPDISEKPRFYFDTSGQLVNGNCYWMVAQTEIERELLLLIQGVANSELMVKYHDVAFNNRLYAGRRRYLTQYVENYPVPDISLPASRAIINIVKKLGITNNKHDINLLESELEVKVAEAFGVEPTLKMD